MSIFCAGSGRSLRTVTEQVQLHHSDLAAASQLQIRNLEHRRALYWRTTSARHLHRHLLRIRIEHKRRNLERWLEFDGRDLEWSNYLDRSLSLLRGRQLKRCGREVGNQMQTSHSERGRSNDGWALLLGRRKANASERSAGGLDPGDLKSHLEVHRRL